MSNEELALVIQAGDREQLPVLWEQVRRLCYKIINRYYQLTVDNIAVTLEDLRQESHFALVEAVKRFKPEMGSFNSILDLCTRKRCRQALGLNGRVKKEHYYRKSMDEPLREGEDMTLADLLEDDTLPGMTDELELDELQRDVRAAVDRLPRVEGGIVRKYYLEGEPVKVIADERGVTPGWIQTKKFIALERLRADQCMREYAAVSFHRYKGVKAFRSSGSSVVEDLVLQMEAAEERRQAQIDKQMEAAEERRQAQIDKQIKEMRKEMIAYAWGRPMPRASGSAGAGRADHGEVMAI